MLHRALWLTVKTLVRSTNTWYSGTRCSIQFSISWWEGMIIKPCTINSNTTLAFWDDTRADSLIQLVWQDLGKDFSYSFKQAYASVVTTVWLKTHAFIKRQHNCLNTQVYIQIDRQTDTDTYIHTYIQRYIHTYRQTDKDTYIHTDRQTDTDTYIHTDRQTDRQRYIHTYVNEHRPLNKQAHTHT